MAPHREFDDLPALSDPLATDALIESTSRTLTRQLAFTVTAGVDRGKEFRSTSDAIVIGTHPSATWQLSDRTVSRFHCEIALVEDEHSRLRDLDSRNGTRVNGVLIKECFLEDGQLVRLGETEISCRSLTTQVSTPISDHTEFGELVGASVKMRRAFGLLQVAAAHDVHVLLLGETGTGKELAASAIHSHGRRRDKPFVVVDCGALSNDLVLSDLFGHVRGAFTGADHDRPGAFEEADGGTVFLDEIGELPIDLQPTLLRVLESGTVRRLGTVEDRPVDFRVIAATHRDLRCAVNNKLFRSDLYHRLAVFSVTLPPLRERVDDLRLLVTKMCEELGVTAHQRRELLTESTLEQLRHYPWPGNVRELRNHIAVALVRGQLPTFADHAPASLSIDVNVKYHALKERWLNHLEKAYLEALMDEFQGNVAKVSTKAGLSRMHVYRALRKHRLK